MARYKLRSPDQPLPLQLVLGLYEFCASLKLAVILIFSAAIVLGWATFVERWYGLSGVQYGIYGTWWFALLNGLLALNIFCAAAIRFPWQRYQTGFVITHLGLLTLLFGCLLSRQYGIDAQMPVFENKTAQVAYEDNQFFALTVHRLGQGGSTMDDPQRGVQPLPPVRFDAGVFNWGDYGDRLLWLPFSEPEDKLYQLPWGLAHRDRGVIYDADGIQLEVLDYYADSTTVGTPYVKLGLSNPMQGGMAEGGQQGWSTIPLEIRETRDVRSRPHAKSRAGGGQLLFWMAKSQAETDAFLNSQPDTEMGLGERGQVVLYVAGKPYRFPIDEHVDGERFALVGAEDNGEAARYEAQIVQYTPTGMTQVAPEGGLELQPIPGAEDKAFLPAVEIEVFGLGDEAARLVLFADMPERSLQLDGPEVYGSYWFDHGEKTAAELMQGQGGSRIDIVQGHDQKLYYRYWNRKEVAALGPLPDGQAVDAFKMPMAQLQMVVQQHLASAEPSQEVLPLAFNKDVNPRDAERAAKLRMTVDGNAREFWLVGRPFDPFSIRGSDLNRQVVTGKDRLVSVELQLYTVDVGYTVRLDDFERTLDPGTSTDRTYSSTIDLLDAKTGKVLNNDVLISMNAPIDFTDPYTGRKLRLFQEAFRGPFKPGDGVYEIIYPDGADGKAKAMSVLTVNYDPGRGVKYTGCLLIVGGIATMFYMRAYFFKKPTPHETRPAQSDAQARPREKKVQQPVA